MSMDKKVAVVGGGLIFGSLAALFAFKKPAKKPPITAAALAAANAATASTSPIAGSGYPKQAKVATSSGPLNVRSSASATASVVASVPKGTAITIAAAPVLGDATQAAGWAPVTTSAGQHGYASMEYLAVNS